MAKMSDKKRFPLAVASKVAEKLVEKLSPACKRIIVAGSIRRQKPNVGDIEILYIPKMTLVPNPECLFGDEKIEVNAVDLVLKELIEAQSLEKRKNAAGSEMWGDLNKFAIAVKTGIPVDLFTATDENWFNYLVCRTGGALTNTQIATEAMKRGFKWNPYGAGFSPRLLSGNNKAEAIRCEKDVFEFVGLPYREPRERP